MPGGGPRIESDYQSVRLSSKTLNRYTVPNATRLLERADGTADPYFCDFDDGVTRIVKWHRRTEPFHGAKSCFNELIASRLGQLIDAPVVRGTVVFVSEDNVPTPQEAGFHFGSVRMTGFDVRHLAGQDNHASVGPFLNAVANRSQFAATALFLAWLRIQDHVNFGPPMTDHASCVFVEEQHYHCPEPVKLYRLIDFDGAFGTGHWGEQGTDLPDVSSPHVLPPYLRALIDPETLRQEFDKLQRVTEASINACFDDIPNNWLDLRELEHAKRWTIERASLLGSSGHLTDHAIELS